MSLLLTGLIFALGTYTDGEPAILDIVEIKHQGSIGKIETATYAFRWRFTLTADNVIEIVSPFSRNEPDFPDYFVDAEGGELPSELKVNVKMFLAIPAGIAFPGVIILSLVSFYILILKIRQKFN